MSIYLQFSSVTQLCLTLCDPMDCSTPGFSVHCQLPEFAQTHIHWVSDAIQPSHPLSPTSPPALSLSPHQGLSNESVLCIRWPKYWSLSFSISPPNEYSGLISFRIEWFDLLTAQGTLKNLLHHHILKAQILQCWAFFIAQLSQESFEEAAFELSFEELFIRLAHRETGGNYMCVIHLGTLSKNSLQCYFLISLWLHDCPFYMLSKHPILSWAALTILAFNQYIH